MAKWKVSLICLALALAIWAVFFPLCSSQFINYDDQEYVYDNASIQAGLNWTALQWAFTSGYASNWHPLTWISHLLDWQLYGRRAGGHHATSLLFHCLNSLLLFGLCRRLTGAIWRSALVAALFSLHPLHVESVAWVSERKDVLSTFFGLLAIWAYARWVEKSKVQSPKSKVEGHGDTQHATRNTPLASRFTFDASRFYLLSLLLFALSLMSKPMLVTLPFLLLLLDYWPLQRLRLPVADAGVQGSRFKVQGSTVPLLLLEKLPFFALAAASSLITFLVQRNSGAMRSLAEIPLNLRLANGLVSYVVYLRRMVWPADLAVFYPHPASIPGWQMAGAGLLLAAISWLAFSQIRRRPWLAFGWCWYLGALVPVLGLVHVGGMAAADHYTYVPLIGVFIMVVWSAAEWVDYGPAGRPVGVAAAVLLVAACAGWSVRQVRFWADSQTLFQQALKVTRGNFVAHNCLGAVLFGQNKFAEAEAHFRQALASYPRFPEAENFLANTLASENRFEEALPHYRQALLLRPDYASAYKNLGLFYGKQNRWPEASANLARAIALGWKSGLAYATLSQTLEREGKTEEAIVAAETAVRLEPTLAEAHFQLGLLQASSQKTAAALPHLQEAIRLRPDWTPPLSQLAWLLATAPETALRNGARSVELAERAAALTQRQDAQVLNILAAAYAEAGRFPDAIRTAEEAIPLAAAAKQAGLARALQRNLQLYRTGQPVRQKR
jgi:tetratricopeptide (TPR) repeat protein